VLLVLYIACVSQRFHAICLQPVIEKKIGATVLVILMSLKSQDFAFAFACHFILLTLLHLPALQFIPGFVRRCVFARAAPLIHATRHLFSYQRHLPPPVRALPSIRLQWSTHSRRPCA
jgi:hypothetical protein